jgi:hypothetical protein
MMIASAAAQAGANMTPVAVTGFNRDVVVENTAVGPPFTNYAMEMNAGEGTAYYETDLPQYAWGLPTSGEFVSLLGDNTIFQFQPYTTNNALDLSADTGLTNGTLTLVSPATYATLAILANSGNGVSDTAPLTLNFTDGTSISTSYFAPDWFNESGTIAWFGPGRVDLITGDDTGGPEGPCFFETSISLAALMGVSNKPLASITFGKADAHSTAIYAVSGLPAGQAPAPELPLTATGWNRDLVVENTASGPPYTNYASEFNPGEGTAYYQAGLTNTSYGLPENGFFTSLVDGNGFQLQPYTGNNALVMSSETGITQGTLTFPAPALCDTLSVIANSANGGGTSSVNINFSDGTTLATNFNAQDWFTGGFDIALAGFDRINLTTGVADGGPTYPQFYETTYDLTALFGATNKPIKSLTFYQAAGAGATAVYAVSGVSSSQTNGLYARAVVSNGLPSTVQTRAATLYGAVVSTGGAAPEVFIYYGTADQGTNAANWNGRINLGFQAGAFSQILGGLSVNTTYYFRAAAINPAGVAWAPASQSFTTASAHLATVTNLPATNIGPNSAILAGDVVLTGGDAPVITIFYGPSNGGDTAVAWSNSVVLAGTQNGWFGTAVTGLASSSTYFFAVQASNIVGISWPAPVQSFTTPAGTAARRNYVSVLTGRDDNARTGQNTNETILTPADVNTNTFGLLFTLPLDGYLLAEPLIMANVAIPGQGVHNVVFAATEHDDVYAFDADTNGPPLWYVSFIDPAAGVTTVSTTIDLQASTSPYYYGPEVGISGTPVIDPATSTLYVAASTKEVADGATNFVHRLHALDVTTGAEKFGGPVVIQASVPGVGDGFDPVTGVAFNPAKEMNRPALLLSGGLVCVTFASHQDFPPYHGWVFTFNAYNLQQEAVFNTTPNGSAGSIWQSSSGPAADDQGNIFMETGNGTFDPANQNYGDSVIKLSPVGGLTLQDYFAPYNQLYLNIQDLDIGSAGLMLLPDSAGSAAHPHLLVAGSKSGTFWLLDRDNLGQYNPAGDTQIVQEISGETGGMWVTPAYFNGVVYYCAADDYVEGFAVSNAAITATPISQSSIVVAYPGMSVMVSANGTSNAIVWGIDGSANQGGPTVLHALNAANLTELYNSSQVPARDTPGNAIKYTMPTIANGKVYVGAVDALSVFGSLAPSPIISPDGGVFTNSVTVSLSSTIPGASLYFTLDGTAPTTNSTLYAVPIVLTNTAGLQAIATLQGQGTSLPEEATFFSIVSIGTGTGLLGSYYSNTLYTDPFVGTPVARTDPEIDFDWNTSAPFPDFPMTNYTVRWVGLVQPQFSETYTFWTTTDDGTRLWVNGQELVNEWNPEPATTWSGTIVLQAGQLYSLEMDYFQAGGGAAAELQWSCPSLQQTVIPQTQLYPLTNPLFLTPPGSLNQGGFSLQVSAVAGQSYVVEGSVDLIHWVPLGTNSATAPSLLFLDTNAANLPWRFYRAFEQPAP